jgi:hypothetical protein
VLADGLEEAIVGTRAEPGRDNIISEDRSASSSPATSPRAAKVITRKLRDLMSPCKNLLADDDSLPYIGLPSAA